MKGRQTIEQLWKCVYANGIGDTLQGLHFLSYFFILKGLEERSFHLGLQDTTFLGIEAEACHWSMLKNMAATSAAECSQHMRTNVSSWLCSLDPDSCLSDAPYAFAQIVPDALYRLMDAIDSLCQEALSLQDAFESVLAWAEQEGAFQPRAGQIMTPPHIAYLMADLVRPQPHERVMDVSCGTGNLLVSAWQQMQHAAAVPAWSLSNGRMLFEPEASRLSDPSLLGYDYDIHMPALSYAHLLLCGVEKPHIRCSDALGSVFNKRLVERTWGNIDVILGNPPYSGFLDQLDLGETLRSVGTQDTELLFVELTLQLLREGGRAALLVPEGVVRNSSRAVVELRKKLVQNHRLLAVVSLPQGIFLPHTNIKSTLLLFNKGGHTGEDVLFYRALADGYTLDAKRQETPTKNDLWDIRMQVAASLGQTAPAPASEILDQDWWAQYASDKRYPSTVYVLPVTATKDIDPATGKRVPAFQQLLGFAPTTERAERSRFVSLEEIKAKNYSLCADTYREDPFFQPVGRRGRLR